MDFTVFTELYRHCLCPQAKNVSKKLVLRGWSWGGGGGGGGGGRLGKRRLW